MILVFRSFETLCPAKSGRFARPTDSAIPHDTRYARPRDERRLDLEAAAYAAATAPGVAARVNGSAVLFNVFSA